MLSRGETLVMNPRMEGGGLQGGFQLGRLLQARDMTSLSQGRLSGYNQTSHRAPLRAKLGTYGCAASL